MNTETKHTPLVRHGNLIQSGKVVVFKVGTNILESVEKSNGERLIAVWNACLAMADPEKEITELARIRDEVLPVAQTAISKQIDEIAILRTDKVELLEALKGMMEWARRVKDANPGLN